MGDQDIDWNAREQELTAVTARRGTSWPDVAMAAVLVGGLLGLAWIVGKAVGLL